MDQSKNDPNLLEIRKVSQAWVVTEGGYARGKLAREPGQDEFSNPGLVKKGQPCIWFTSDGSKSETSDWESRTSLNPPPIARLSLLGETALFFVAATVRRSSSILTLRSEATPCGQRSLGRLAPFSRSSDKSEGRPTNARHVVAPTHCTNVTLHVAISTSIGVPTPSHARLSSCCDRSPRQR